MDENIKQLCNECLQCKHPTCIEGCLAHNNIPLFIKLAKEDKIQEAFEVICKTSTLPGICSIVCPHEKACMGNCIKSKMNKSVKIPLIENYIAKNAVSNTNLSTSKNNKKIALIGSGPASLACGEKLSLMGYIVDIYDKFEVPGGILTYGIPAFVLNKDVVNEKIDYLKKIGVNFILNKALGKDYTIDSLRKQYDALFIGIGASKKKKINVLNENLVNIIDANEYLMQVYQKKFDTTQFKNIIVVGGGNTAIDAARVAKKETPNSNVCIVYRRSENEMPARKVEYDHALNDSVDFKFLTNPIEFIGQDKVEKTICEKMTLIKTNEDRLKPIPIENSAFEITSDLVILAISSNIENEILDGININSWGGIIVNEHFQTNIENVFAGGDCINGPSLVATAMKNGIEAANNINEYLSQKD